ncbi:uncharacterized protein LOC135383837 [Ornithodoros turicata]|uniref:uncharacterized protein LOC135383837 n=1 Tax=Ornithodoros turicata TaxID=34597 RepID=UPI0031398C4C
MRMVNYSCCQLLVLLTFTCLLVVTAAEASVDYNADMAVEEVGRMFNMLFPLLPAVERTPPSVSWRSLDEERGRSDDEDDRRNGLSLGPSEVAFSGREGGSGGPPPLSHPKRAQSECLMRCLGQRKLHPVQCLTLC